MLSDFLLFGDLTAAMAGWLQGEDPGTDFRGAGFLALQCHLYMAVQEPDLFAALRWKRAGQRSEWEYPFAVAGVNVAFMLAGACCPEADLVLARNC